MVFEQVKKDFTETENSEQLVPVKQKWTSHSVEAQTIKKNTNAHDVLLLYFVQFCRHCYYLGQKLIRYDECISYLFLTQSMYVKNIQ